MLSRVYTRRPAGKHAAGTTKTPALGHSRVKAVPIQGALRQSSSLCEQQNILVLLKNFRKRVSDVEIHQTVLRERPPISKSV
jgi:hypothetical protein